MTDDAVRADARAAERRARLLKVAVAGSAKSALHLRGTAEQHRGRACRYTIKRGVRPVVDEGTWISLGAGRASLSGTRGVVKSRGKARICDPAGRSRTDR